MSIKIALVVFPGSNCDTDCRLAFLEGLGIDLVTVWHQKGTLPDRTSGVILPGGFSYGDYLRSGALAAHSRIMAEVREFAGRGGPVLGICNGFQILTESGILPGTLMRNSSGQFICSRVSLKGASGHSTYHRQSENSVIHIPIAHGEGRYYIDEDGLKGLEDRGQIVFQYCSEDGSIEPAFNPNGSVQNIAGICSQNGRVLGLMPHPERAVFTYPGCDATSDGLGILRSFVSLVG
jgi:phosphoribosylformylglycinamidine synthase